MRTDKRGKNKKEKKRAGEMHTALCRAESEDEEENPKSTCLALLGT